MEKLLLHLFIAIALTSVFNDVYAQAPNITYGTPTNVYTVGTAITNLVPTNAGGAVPATTYAQVTTLFGPGTLNGPFAIAIDGAGNVYVADYYNNKIRKITPAGVQSVLAGSGTAGEVNGTGILAQFNGPQGLVYDGAGNLYVGDGIGNTIRKIVIATGVVTTYAGTGISGTTNGARLTATFNGPEGLTFDSSGNLFIAEFNSNLIREISAAGTVSTLAGSGAAALTNGTGIAAAFNNPIDLVADGSGNLFVADYLNNVIRKIVISTKAVTTFAAGFSRPSSIDFDASNNLLVCDQFNSVIKLITPGGVVTTIAGSGASAETNGTGTAAAFTNPVGIEMDNLGNGYIEDWPTTNGTVRKIVLTGYTISPAALPAGLNFNGTTGVISGTPTASAAATIYTITGFNASGSSSAAISIACGVSVAWTGNTSTVWALTTNWSPAIIPGTNDAVSIGVSAYTGIKAEPLITTAVTVGSVTLGNNGGMHNLTITSPGKLNIGGYLTELTTVMFPIKGTGDLNIAPGATLNVNGTGILNINLTGKFTLQSNATGSATVGQMLKTSIAGTHADSINVERYLTGGPGYRAYRLLSSPVYAATVAGDNVYSVNYLHDDIFLTGTLGAVNGFDKAGNPTIFLFREDQIPALSFTSGNFLGISKINVTSASHGNYDYYINGGVTNTNIGAGNGMMVYFRGDRTTVNPYLSTTVPVSATVTATGRLNAGMLTVHMWYNPLVANLGYTGVGLGTNFAARGFNLVGNPYASSIDWETFQTTTPSLGIYGNNVANTIYEWNPVTGTYATYQQGGASTNNGQRIIVSGEGFFVLATNILLPTLTFNESAKVSTQNTGLNLFMTAKADLGLVTNTNPNRYFRLQLALDDIQKDDIYIGFNNQASNNYVLNEDAAYKSGTGKVSLGSISNDNVTLAINKLPFPKLSPTTIKLKVGASTNGTYKLNLIEIKRIPQIFEIWLMDGYKKDSIDIRHNNTYAFDINTDTNSYGSNRFKLVIRQNQSLALHLLNFTATKVIDGARLEWTTENEHNYTNFTIEKSTDNGTTFNVLGGFISESEGVYDLLDKNPLPIGAKTATNEYRLKMQDLNGTISYSEVVTLMYSDPSNNIVNHNISVYPDPATNFINLTINSNTPGLTSDLPALIEKDITPDLISKTKAAGPSVYGIKIINMTGSVVKTATTSSVNWQTSVSNFLPGTYIIQVVNNDNNSLIGKSTFIKL